jgi:hypothetical protein
MSDKKDYVSLNTGLGKARYPKLDKQDTYEGKEVGYKCGLVLEGKALAEAKKDIDAAIAKLAPGGKLKAGKKSPLRETEDGTFYIEAKSYNKVPLFKPKGGEKFPESTKLGGGSTIRMKLSLTLGNGHLVAYMNAIQVAELVSGGSDGFDDLDGYEQPEEDDSSFGDTDDLDLDI